MDFPISVPSIGLVNGKFADEDPLAGTPGSLIPAQWGNAVTAEILNVITGGGLVPNEAINTQLLTAIKAVVTQAGVSPGRLIGVRVFNVPGTFTYTPTPGTASVIIKVHAGGGAGGGSQATAAGTVSVCPGGNAGAYGESRLTSGFSGATIIVGAGGTGVLGAAGNPGGASSFGGSISAPGGQGGPTYGANPAPVLNINYSAQTTATGGTIVNAPGGRGQPGVASGVSYGGSGDGGASVFGSGGAASGVVGTPTNGKAGVSPGSGGSGGAGGAGAGASTGGAGAPGIVIVLEYA